MKYQNQIDGRRLAAVVAFKLLLIGVIFCALPSAHAYQVWTSTCKTPRQVLDAPDQWELMAKGIQGLNLNYSPAIGNDSNPSTEQWRQILTNYTTARSITFVPWNHPDTNVVTTNAMVDWVNGQLARGSTYGYTDIKYVFMTDTEIQWSDNDIRAMRGVLNGMGRTNIGILFNARNLSEANKTTLSMPEVAAGVNEGSPDKWASNTAGRQDLLRWFTTNNATKNKPLFFQLTVHHNWNDGVENFGSNDVYQAVRLFVRSIAADILQSTNWIGTDKAIILPMTYDPFPTNFPFLPERNLAGDAYGNSMSGTLLSLIEQRNLFEGRAPGGLISVAQCKSFARTAYYTAVADGNVTNPATWSVPFPVPGDLNNWHTGAHTLGADGASPNSTNGFNGETLVVSTNGTLAGNVAGVTLRLNKLFLNGGRILANQTDGFNVDLTGHVFTLGTGSLQGGAVAGQNLRFQNGSLAGSSTVPIAALGAGGGQVEFADTMNLKNFRGTFRVASNGVLNLPTVSAASFSLELSGTGKYLNDTSIIVNSLAINGTNLPGGVYYYTNFSVAQRAFLVNTTGKISVIGDATAIKDGNLNDPATWLVGPPGVGDENSWKTGAHTLSADDVGSNPLTFYGGTLVIQPGGQLIPSGGGATIKLNQLTLDGGTITTFRLTPINIDLTGHTFTLNSGTLQAGQTSNSRNIKFHNAVMAGSGLINVTALDAAGYYIELTDNIDLSGFTGVFNVVTNGTLRISSDSIAAASFGIRLSGSGHLHDVGTTNLLLASLVIASVSFPEDTYYYTNFTPAQQAYFVNTNQIVTVVDTAYAQWAEGYQLVGGKYGDDDGDGYFNYYEFALGGDPTEPDDHGHVPTGALVKVSNTNWLEFVHVERKPTPNSLIRYFVHATDSLAATNWTTNGVNWIGSGPLDASYNLVTNRVSTAVKNQQFVRLRIQ